MNRHFYNFIACFNAAAKSRKWTFRVPLRNKFTYKFINYLFIEKIIQDYRFVAEIPDLSHNAGALFGPKCSKKYHYPLEIQLKNDFIASITSVSTPGKYKFLRAKKLLEYSMSGGGGGAVVICSSARFGGFCTARELISRGEGGLVICTVRFSR